MRSFRQGVPHTAPAVPFVSSPVHIIAYIIYASLHVAHNMNLYFYFEGDGKSILKETAPSGRPIVVLNHHQRLRYLAKYLDSMKDLAICACVSVVSEKEGSLIFDLAEGS